MKRITVDKNFDTILAYRNGARIQRWNRNFLPHRKGRYEGQKEWIGTDSPAFADDTLYRVDPRDEHLIPHKNSLPKQLIQDMNIALRLQDQRNEITRRRQNVALMVIIISQAAILLIQIIYLLILK